MKKNQKILLIVLGGIALVALAFAVWRLFSKPKAVPEIPEQTSSTTQVVIENKMTEKTFSEQNNFYEIEAKYPLDPRDTEKDVEVFVLYNIKERQTDWKVGGELYNEEQELTKRFPERAKIKYTFDLSYETKNSATKGTTTYILTSYQYTGGAHGSSVVNTFTFNDKGILHIEDILDLASGNNAVSLSKILAKRILATNKDATTEDMVLEGTGVAFLKADGVTLDKEKCNCDGFNFASNFQNFYITDEGITFLFSQYQVAPGAAGTVKTSLDWATLKPFLVDPNF